MIDWEEKLIYYLQMKVTQLEITYNKSLGVKDEQNFKILDDILQRIIDKDL